MTRKIKGGIIYQQCGDDVVRYAEAFIEKGASFRHTFAIRTMLEALPVSSLSDINDFTFEKHIESVLASKYPEAAGLVCQFYRHLIDEDEITLTKYTPVMLAHKDFPKKYAAGYKPVVYSPYADMPDEDRLFIDIHDCSISTYGTAGTDILEADFSDIRNCALKYAYKHFFWHYQEKISSKKSKDAYLRKFLSVADGMTDENEKAPVIDSDMVRAFTDRYLKDIKSTSKGAVMSRIRTFFKHCSENSLLKVTKAAEAAAATVNTKSKGDTRTYTVEEIIKIEDYLQKKYVSENSEIYYLAFMIVKILEKSPLRPASVLRLKTDCLKPTDRKSCSIEATEKKKGKTLTPVADDVAEDIKKVIKFTKKYRTELPAAIKNRLFVYYSPYKRKICALSESSFKKILAEACENSGVRKLQTKGLRNFFNLHMVSEAVKSGKSPAEISALTRHSLTSAMNSYTDAKGFFELVGDCYNVSIGDVEIKSEVRDSYESSGNDRTEGGYCKSDECRVAGLTPCVICRRHVTTPAFQDFYENAIAEIDRQIEKCTIPHERESLVWHKKVYVRVLSEILFLKKQIKEGGK